eukprot:3113699-Rhodomonas_salina.1
MAEGFPTRFAAEVFSVFASVYTGSARVYDATRDCYEVLILAVTFEPLPLNLGPPPAPAGFEDSLGIPTRVPGYLYLVMGPTGGTKFRLEPPFSSFVQLYPD